MSGLYSSPPGPLSPKRGEGEKTRWDHANPLGFRDVGKDEGLRPTTHYPLPIKTPLDLSQWDGYPHDRTKVRHRWREVQWHG